MVDNMQYGEEYLWKMNYSKTVIITVATIRVTVAYLIDMKSPVSLFSTESSLCYTRALQIAIRNN